LYYSVRYLCEKISQKWSVLLSGAFLQFYFTIKPAFATLVLSVNNMGAHIKGGENNDP